ncbi:hypothetical protein D1B17_07000 [Companilactobacillus zhachilii]|uniref:Uncharacterized protein n=1 Tax=Companilactobacillus zhachilii TaxID=2304606 RepID=A0A386PR42_9LACO|nr:hypothetical protein [Companilactobacillus zhachilii]AYE38396.1 hypothetical protein D1B17_07000 [Companilactobacillus zhachilii]
MKIAVQLDNDRNIVGTVTTSEFGAELQVKLFKDKGWTLVDNDPAFSSSDSYLWTVRQADNKLVHLSTGMTPDEETTNANALLGKNVGKAIVTAIAADKKADNAINSSGKLAKAIAPVLAEYEARQNTSNTTTGGTK